MEHSTKLKGSEFEVIGKYYIEKRKKIFVLSCIYMFFSIFPLMLLIIYHLTTNDSYETTEIIMQFIIAGIWNFCFLLLILSLCSSSDFLGIKKLRQGSYRVTEVIIEKDMYFYEVNYDTTGSTKRKIREISFFDINGKRHYVFITGARKNTDLVGKKAIIINILGAKSPLHAFYFEERN